MEINFTTKIFNTEFKKNNNGFQQDLKPSLFELLKQDKQVGKTQQEYYTAEPDALRVARHFIIPKNNVEEVKAKIEPKIKDVPDIPTSYSVKFNVAKNLFNGTAEDLDACLAKTKLKGMGKDFMEIQEEFGVNALFLMSIAKVESGYGNAPMKGKPYNIVGAIGQKPKSYKECIYKLARNLRKNYINSNRTNPKDINKKYSANDKWADEVVKEMTRLSKKIKSHYE